MLRRAIARRPRYVSAMTNLGVTLQANRKVKRYFNTLLLGGGGGGRGAGEVQNSCNG